MLQSTHMQEKKKYPFFVERLLVTVSPSRQAEHRINLAKTTSAPFIDQLKQTSSEDLKEASTEVLSVGLIQVVGAAREGHSDETLKKIFNQFSKPVIDLLLPSQE